MRIQKHNEKCDKVTKEIEWKKGTNTTHWDVKMTISRKCSNEEEEEKEE